MKVGTLGDIVFQVSDSTVLTLRNVKWTESADYSTHKRHGGTTLNEFVGSSPGSITFSIRLSEFLGVNTVKQLKQIMKYMRDGKTLRLVIGRKIYGRYRWVITKTSNTMEYYDKRGNLTQADVQLTLSEYIKK